MEKGNREWKAGGCEGVSGDRKNRKREAGDREKRESEAGDREIRKGKAGGRENRDREAAWRKGIGNGKQEVDRGGIRRQGE